MKLKDLEKQINEKIEKEGLNQEKLSSWKITDTVRKVVRELLDDNEKIYFYEYKGMIIIKKSCSSSNYGTITIKIKKKIAGKEYTGWRYQTLYTIKNVEVEGSINYDSIESYIAYYEKMETDKINYENKRMTDFENELSKMNIDFKKFYDMMDEYKHLSYDSKCDLAKKYAGKEYYSYY